MERFEKIEKAFWNLYNQNTTHNGISVHFDGSYGIVVYCNKILVGKLSVHFRNAHDPKHYSWFVSIDIMDIETKVGFLGKKDIPKEEYDGFVKLIKEQKEEKLKIAQVKKEAILDKLAGI